MNPLENIATSLEMSKKMQKEGIDFESALVWVRELKGKQFTLWQLEDIKEIYEKNICKFEIIPAPTAGEMIDGLPDKLSKNNIEYKLNIGKENGIYFANYVSIGDLLSPDFDSKLLKEALAKLCLWCKKEGYLK